MWQCYLPHGRTELGDKIPDCVVTNATGVVVGVEYDVSSKEQLTEMQSEAGA